jgi:hypothetical protein
VVGQFPDSRPTGNNLSGRARVQSPLSLGIDSASPAECQLVELLAGSFLDELPARFIGD